MNTAGYEERLNDLENQSYLRKKGRSLGNKIAWTLFVFACVLSPLPIIWFMGGSLSSSPVCVMAMEKASTDPRVAEKVGTPVERGHFITGSMKTTLGVGYAVLKIPVHGPRGSGYLYAAGDSNGERWTLRRLTFQKNGEAERIILVGGSGTAPGQLNVPPAYY